MPRVSVEIEVVQLPAGYLWRFCLPADIAPQDPREAALAGLTGPFPSEALAHDHARRSLEQLVRERIRMAMVGRAPPGAAPVDSGYRKPHSTQGSKFWTQESPTLWTRRYPRDDIKLEADVWVKGGQTFWMVTLNDAPIAQGAEPGEHHTLAKRQALDCMSRYSASCR